MVISSERIVRRTPAEVFRFVVTDHFANHPKWDPEVVEMTPLTPGPVGVGATARLVRQQGRRRVEGTCTVTAYEPEQVGAFDVRFGVFQLRQRVDCFPEHSGNVTRLRLTIESRAEGLLKALVPLMRSRFRRTMERNLATIASLIEGGARLEPPAELA
jgi:hypothetical protein